MGWDVEHAGVGWRSGRVCKFVCGLNAKTKLKCKPNASNEEKKVVVGAREGYDEVR